MLLNLRCTSPPLLPFSIAVLFLCIVFSCHALSTEGPGADLTLSGIITGAQNQTYVEVPFKVPPSVFRVTLTFAYTGKEQHSTLDLGMLDPNGLRCWSGGNKSTLTVSASDATPSCLPGPIPSGTWKVLIGVPNIRAGQTSTYTAKLYFSRTGRVADEPLVLRKPIRTGLAWYRGDLHMHTAHSDGSCNSLAGNKVPCPVFLIADAAARRGLDFIAVTDHNATSHYESMRELAPYFDTLLLIPGREITTFHGHANLFGTEDFLDFRLGTREVPDINTLLRRAKSLGGLISLNHPAAPTGESCMGCGWSPSTPTDFRLVNAIEAVNSGAMDGPFAGTPFWEQQLNRGYRLTAIGGSDNHTAQRPLQQVGSIGSPTTVVHAAELSTVAILQAIRAGHVFVDLTGSKDRILDVSASSAGKTAAMGDTLDAPPGSPVAFSVHTAHVPGATVKVTEDGQPFPTSPTSSLADSDQTTPFTWTSDGHRHWFRVDIEGPGQKLWLLGNPVYLNYQADTVPALAPSPH